jgi:hypothetical protein
LNRAGAIEIFTTARCGYRARTKALLDMSGELAEMLGAKEAP